MADPSRRGVLSRLAGWWLERSTSSQPQPWFLDWLHGGSGAKSSSGIAVSQLRAMRDVTWMAGISIRALDLAKCPLHVYRTTPDGGQEIITGHAVERLLQEPCWLNKLEFVELMQSAYLNKGNAFAAIKRNGRAQPIALIPIEHAEVRTTSDGELYYYWTTSNQHQAAVLSPFPNPIPAADVFHLKWMSFDGLCGLSRLGLARDAIGLSLALEEYSARLFAQGTRPGGVFETDKKMNDDSYKRFMARLAVHRGSEGSGQDLVLEEGLKWKLQAMTSVESQTIEARRLQIEQIATALDMPQHRLGIQPAGGATEINQAHQMYLNNTISGDAERWESKLNQIFGFDGVNTFVEFDLDYFNRADLKTRMESYRIGIAGSVYKVNEVRHKEGYGSVPHGDVVLQPANVVPLGTVPTKPSTPGPGSDTSGESAPGGDGDPAAVAPV